MRYSVLVVLVALLQQACIAHGLAGIGRDQPGTDQFSVAPAEGDAKLVCGESACTSVQVEQPYTRGRNNSIYWPVFLAETVAGIAGTVFFVNYGTQTDPVPAGSFTIPEIDTGKVVLSALAATACMMPPIFDTIAYMGSREYGRQNQPWRLATPLMADYRGMKVPLQISDVVPFGAEKSPATFPVAGALALKNRPAFAPAPVAIAASAKMGRGGKVAVLDLRSSAQGMSLDDVRYFGDLVRGATLKAAPQVEVMTRENLLVLLQASGKDLANCEGECEVDTGRRIGADAIVSGEVLKVGTRFKLTLRLHETHAGKLLGAAVASGRNIEELDDSVSRAVADLFGGAL